MTHFDLKEGTAECWQTWNDFQEFDFGLLHCHATLLAVGGDDVLQVGEEAKRKEVDIPVMQKLHFSWFLASIFLEEYTCSLSLFCFCTFLPLPSSTLQETCFLSDQQEPAASAFWGSWQTATCLNRLGFWRAARPGLSFPLWYSCDNRAGTSAAPVWRHQVLVTSHEKECKPAEFWICLIEYLWKMKSEVCNQILARGHIEPELPLVNQVHHIGLADWEARLNYEYKVALSCKSWRRQSDALPSFTFFPFLRESKFWVRLSKKYCSSSKLVT